MSDDIPNSGNQDLTKRQSEIFGFIRDQIHDRGYGPTVREIGDAFGISSPNGVMCHLRALEKKGHIIRDAKKSRAIELVHDCRGMPLVGVVPASPVALMFEQDDRIDFGEMFGRDDLFALQVSGDSMIEAQIADGDYVVVRKQPTASRGDMVVAQTPEGESTLKYWYPEADHVRLQPANSEMQPMRLPDARVVGVVVGVVRSV